MCSRFDVNKSPRDLALEFKLECTPTLPNKAEVRPTDLALVIYGNGQSDLRTWGIPALWNGKPVFNARSETLLEKQIFRPFLATPCLIPATSFPEWRKVGKTRLRNDVSLAPDNTEHCRTMAFAGLMNETHTTMITCAAAPRMAHVHGRMPVILSGQDTGRWLDETPIENRITLLKPYLGDDLQVIEAPISPPDQPDLFM